uniref:Toll-like receptor 1 n=1 Tax=Sinocyclocheilus grahami TaxID=75366 RepID=A0A672PII3_SINGR
MKPSGLWLLSVYGTCFHPSLILAIKRIVVNYSSQSLSSVPPGLKPCTEDLDLSLNRIQTLSAKDFSTTPRLHFLNLSWNILENIDRDAFNSTPALEILDLSHNRLQNLSDQPWLGLSAKSISNQDFTCIANLTLKTLFINANSLQTYEENSLTEVRSEKAIIALSKSDFDIAIAVDVFTAFKEVEFTSVDSGMKAPQRNPTHPTCRIPFFTRASVTEFIFNQKERYDFFINMPARNVSLTQMLIIFMTCPLTVSQIEVLDLSDRKRYRKHLLGKCIWPPKVVQLDLSSNGFDHSIFKCLPDSIRILNLRNNRVTTVSSDLQVLDDLRVLDLMDNSLLDLPTCVPKSAEALSLETCLHVDDLVLSHNPLICTCALREVTTLIKDRVTRPRGETLGLTPDHWPEGYRCSYPESWSNSLLEDFYLPEISCNAWILAITILIPTITVIVAVSLLCNRLDVPWYLKMIWKWMRAKHNAITSQGKRKTWKGCASMHSYRTAKRMLTSEWCHYELYFANHTRVTDSIILILLEPLPLYLIPSKYYQLKAMMSRRTYLEWPPEGAKQKLFWANLRAACIFID